MSAVIDRTEEKQIFKMPNGEFEIEMPEPFYFVVKTNRTFTDRELLEIDETNEDLRIELNSNGDFEIMPPPFPEISRRNMTIDAQLWNWAKQDGRGICFESSAKLTLPNGAKRMPDAAWILKERYLALPLVEREERFAEICPDFVIELRSKSDRLKNLETKMREYIENGAQLGWLIDPYEKKVHIYRNDETVEIINEPEKVSGENVLLNFELDLREIW